MWIKNATHEKSRGNKYMNGLKLKLIWRIFSQQNVNGEQLAEI